MTDPRHAVVLRTHALALAIVLSPALMQSGTVRGCEPTIPLTSLEVAAAEGASAFEPLFPADRHSYQVVLDSGSTGVVLSAYADDPTSEIRYTLVDLTSDSVVAEELLPPGGGEALILDEITFEDRGTPPPCKAHELRVSVTCASGAEGVCIAGNYKVRVVHLDHCPNPMPCAPSGCAF
jgi:hypothetical protein